MTEGRGPCQYCGPDDDSSAIIYIDQLGPGERKSGAVCHFHGLKALSDLFRGDKMFMIGNLASTFDAWGEADWFYLGVCSDNHLAVAFIEYQDEDDSPEAYFNALAKEGCESCRNLVILWQKRFDRIVENVFEEEPWMSEEADSTQGASMKFWGSRRKVK